MTFLSVKALRHYHEVGLLPPAEIDPGTGYRRYQLEQVPMAQVIRRLRELGMSLDDVRAVIEAPDIRARNAAISAHLRRMEGELEQTRATVKSLRLLLDAGGAGADRDQLPDRGAVRHARDPRGDRARRHVSRGWTRRLRSCSPRLRSGRRRRRALLRRADGGRVRRDRCPRPGWGRGGRRVHVLELPRVEYAVAVHAGPLEEVDRTYAALGAVVAERAIGVQGHLRENYLSDDRIEICWPVFQTTPVA